MKDRNPTTGKIIGIVGEISQERVRTDRIANAEQDTRPNITLTNALRALRTKD